MRCIQKNIISSNLKLFWELEKSTSILRYSFLQNQWKWRENSHWNHSYAVYMHSETKKVYKIGKTRRRTCNKLLLRNKSSNLPLCDDRKIGKSSTLCLHFLTPVIACVDWQDRLISYPSHKGFRRGSINSLFNVESMERYSVNR
jgi:hypothetical protein